MFDFFKGLVSDIKLSYEIYKMEQVHKHEMEMQRRKDALTKKYRFVNFSYDEKNHPTLVPNFHNKVHIRDEVYKVKGLRSLKEYLEAVSYDTVGIVGVAIVEEGIEKFSIWRICNNFYEDNCIFVRDGRVILKINCNTQTVSAFRT